MSVKNIDERKDVIDISFFYKENKKESETVQYVASDNFTDGDGNPIEWTIKPLSADEDALIRESCTDTKENRRTGVINEIFDDNKYLLGITARGVVFPNLKDSGLQNTYGVRSETKLLRKMLNAGELQALALKVIEVSGLDDIEGAMNDNQRKSELLKNN